MTDMSSWMVAGGNEFFAEGAAGISSYNSLGSLGRRENGYSSSFVPRGELLEKSQHGSDGTLLDLGAHS
jgi:hypothetical protein